MASRRKGAWVTDLLLGTLLLVGVAEGALRLLELGFAPRGAGDGSGPVVLCEGDSFTYGLGGRSFPEQLPDVWDGAVGGPGLVAINEGIPGLTSAMVADRLEAHIVAHAPDAIVVVIGENNSWNSLPDEKPSTGAADTLDRWLLRSRVYKFVRVAWIGWSASTFHEAAGVGAPEVAESPENIGLMLDGEQSPNVRSPPIPDMTQMPRFMSIVGQLEQGAYTEVLGALDAWESEIGKTPGLETMRLSALIRLGRYEDGVAVADAALTMPHDPYAEELSFQRGHALRRLGRVPEAREGWRAGLREFPASRALYWSLARSFHDEGRAGDVLVFVEDVADIATNPLHQRLASALAGTPGGTDLSARVREAFEADIGRMIDIAQRHDVDIVFSSYPDALYPEVQSVAQARGVPFLDLRPRFQERFERREDYISPDRCHCNEAGYRLMAEAYVEALRPMLGAQEAL